MVQFPLRGLRHLALKVSDMSRARAFYEGILGMRVVWEPDPENIYLSSGCDNLALHKVGGERPKEEDSVLDHFGFLVENAQQVKEMEEKMVQTGIKIVRPYKVHRDGSVSFYMADPDGNVIQILYEPHLSRQKIM